MIDADCMIDAPSRRSATRVRRVLAAPRPQGLRSRRRYVQGAGEHGRLREPAVLAGDEDDLVRAPQQQARVVLLRPVALLPGEPVDDDAPGVGATGIVDLEPSVGQPGRLLDPRLALRRR